MTTAACGRIALSSQTHALNPISGEKLLSPYKRNFINTAVLMAISAAGGGPGKGGGLLEKPAVEKATPGRESEFDLRKKRKTSPPYRVLLHNDNFNKREYVVQVLMLSKTQFSLKMIASATKSFDDENKIGKGGFGVVFKGILPEGTRIAVKKLSSFSSQGNQEFINEIGLISSLRHPNLVKILGCCSEGDQLLLVYEYMENNSLYHVLLGSERTNFKLDWLRRCNIVLGIAKGLAYLHEESRIKIVHRDIKSTNVLLDKDFNAKISDFGLAKLYDDRNSHITTRIAGTRGYMAPEYAMWGHLTNKVDVYSFGIVLLEVISGKYNIIDFPDKEYIYLPDWARDLQRSGNLLQLVDENLGSQYSQKEAIKMIELGLLCVSATSAIRPSMSEVVSVLEGGEFVGHDPSSVCCQRAALDEFVQSGNLPLRPGVEDFIDDAINANLPVVMLTAYSKNGDKMSRLVIEKLGVSRVSKMKVVGQDEVEGSLYYQLVQGKGVLSSLDDKLAKETQKAVSMEKQRIAKEVASALKLNVDIATNPPESIDQIVNTLRAGAEFAGLPVQECVLIAGSQSGVLGAERIGMPCVVIRSSLTSRAEFHSANAIMDGFGGADLTLTKLRQKI